MAHTPRPPRTPLRRVSQGSLRALSRSGTFPDAPAGLGFLEPVMADLADETETLHTNITGLHALSASLEKFNESFASYLYAMEMNGLTTDWPQAPTDMSFELARKRADEDARAAQAALRAAAEAATAAEKTTTTVELGVNDTTVADMSSATGGQNGGQQPKIAGGILKSGGTTTSQQPKRKPKMSAKEKRERLLAIDKAITFLPLEFRGQDPNLRRYMESVIDTFLENPNGQEILRFVKPPDLNQARVNKCLIALVNKKIVTRDNSTGRVLYIWNGVPS